MTRRTIAKIASLAGVSTATVDRVLNERGGVRSKTVDKVQEAVRLFENGQEPVTARLIEGYVDVILPANAGPSTDFLGAEIRRFASATGLKLRSEFVERMSPSALAAALNDRAERGSAGIAFQALEHQLVREAVDRLTRAGTSVVTLCSDVGGTERLAYVGIDNRAAGRTAGYLMGRFTCGTGKVAVVWGGQLYRGHEEREFGFRSVIRADFPQLDILDLVTGNDDAEENYRRLSKVAAAEPGLIGVYCVGAGITGVVRALDEMPSRVRRVLIGHNLMGEEKSYLLSGRMDAVLHQDMTQIARIAIDVLQSPAANLPRSEVPFEIVIRENLLRR